MEKAEADPARWSFPGRTCLSMVGKVAGPVNAILYNSAILFSTGRTAERDIPGEVFSSSSRQDGHALLGMS